MSKQGEFRKKAKRAAEAGGTAKPAAKRARMAAPPPAEVPSGEVAAAQRTATDAHQAQNNSATPSRRCGTRARRVRGHYANAQSWHNAQ